jgi:hypothetical protein
LSFAVYQIEWKMVARSLEVNMVSSVRGILGAEAGMGVASPAQPASRKPEAKISSLPLRLAWAWILAIVSSMTPTTLWKISVDISWSPFRSYLWTENLHHGRYFSS